MAKQHDDPFEAELASFRPQPVSLELRERIGRQVTRGPIRWLAVTAGLAAAACVVVGLLMMVRDRDVVVEPPEMPRQTVRAEAPTVLDYQRAFAKSPQALDALLARPAGRDTRDGDSPAKPVRAFSRSFSDLANLNGD